MNSRTATDAPPEVAFSNAIRLTGREWIGLGLFTIAFMAVAPKAWQSAEAVPIETDYRIPHDLSNDYWLYDRWAGFAAEHYHTVMIGDSVIWGEYATRRETLSHYLNESSGQERFANLGLDGAHPLALSGLMEYYGGAITGKTIVLHCNPLWMSSPTADMQDDHAAGLNHPRLIPQFVPRLVGYKEDASTRIGVVVERNLPFNSWTAHLQQAFFDRNDIPGWTLEHPYGDPVQSLRRELQSPENGRRHLPQSWDRSGIQSQDFAWIDLATSLQWRAFQQTIKMLHDRRNRVFVLVGPFNEHLLTRESRQRYQQVKDQISAWLQKQNIHYLMPAPLPSEMYGDASHPLAVGYVLLARQLVDTTFFTADP
jgi:hypothetical protein